MRIFRFCLVVDVQLHLLRRVGCEDGRIFFRDSSFFIGLFGLPDFPTSPWGSSALPVFFLFRGNFWSAGLAVPVRIRRTGF